MGILGLFLLFCSADAHAYVRTMAESGRPLYWPSPSVTLRINPQNASGLNNTDVSNLLGSTFASWSPAGTRAAINFTQSNGYPANSNYDGTNAVYFASAAGRSLDDGIVALTEVLYYSASGQIVESDMVFNDRYFRFTNQEGDTGQSIGGKTAIYLRDVATHEVGHVFGLDHTLVNLSSMIFTAFSGQFVPSEDDLTAIRSLYPQGRNPGSLTGRVDGSRGGIFGAHVQAIDLATGKSAAGTLTNPDGTFYLGDLNPGQYALLMEPFSPNSSSVSSYFRNVDHRFCGGGRKFRRRFYGPCGTNEVSVVDVQAGTSLNVNTLAPSCANMGNPGQEPTSPALAAMIPADGAARFGTLRPGGEHYYRISGANGPLEVRALAYSLYSPADVKVEILDLAGNPVNGATSIDNVQQPMPGGFVNYDSLATVNSGGDYLIRVQSANTRLYASAFPAGSYFLDGDGHYLLSVAVNGQFGASTVTDMASCASVNNRAQTASYRQPASQNADRETSGCGTLGGGDGSGPWNGGVGQALLVALLARLGFYWRRKKAALVRKDR